MYGLILAGGSGSRLWPLSRELYPKQLLNIENSESLLQSTFTRLKETIEPEKPKSSQQEIVDDKTNKGLADQLNDELSRKRTSSLLRIPSQENQEVINFH